MFSAVLGTTAKPASSTHAVFRTVPPGPAHRRVAVSPGPAGNSVVSVSTVVLVSLRHGSVSNENHGTPESRAGVETASTWTAHGSESGPTQVWAATSECGCVVAAHPFGR